MYVLIFFPNILLDISFKIDRYRVNVNNSKYTQTHPHPLDNKKLNTF